MYEKFKARFYWYSMFSNMAAYLKQCERCQQQKS